MSQTEKDLTKEDEFLKETLRVSKRVNKLLGVMIPEMAKNEMSDRDWWGLVLEQTSKTMGQTK